MHPDLSCSNSQSNVLNVINKSNIINRKVRHESQERSTKKNSRTVTESFHVLLIVRNKIISVSGDRNADTVEQKVVNVLLITA